MNITTRAQGFELSAPIDAFVRSELELALSRFSEGVVSVDVFLKDINGPKGGIDKQATIRAQLRNRKVVAMETTHADLYAAVKTSIKRSKRAVRRSLKKSSRIGKTRLRDLRYDNSLAAIPDA